MTFDNAAWAIDGAQMNSALARRALYASGSRQAGVVLKNDLKVSQLTAPGSGVRITAGVGMVLNDYQTIPNELYVVSNDAAMNLTPGPASNPSAKSYIVAIVVGDPDFSQTGHPWMLASDPPDGQELTFDYVRPTFIEVSAGATSLDVNYPALPLARVDLPANTTTITDAMITDLRSLTAPRQAQYAFASGDTTWDSTPAYCPSGSAFANWGSAQYAPTVDVPVWAKRAVVFGHINGVRIGDITNNINGKVRLKLNTTTSPETRFDYPTDTNARAIRDNLMCGGGFNVESLAGTTATLRIEGFQENPASPSNPKRLALTTGSQIMFDVRFFEE